MGGGGGGKGGSSQQAPQRPFDGNREGDMDALMKTMKGIGIGNYTNNDPNAARGRQQAPRRPLTGRQANQMRQPMGEGGRKGKGEIGGRNYGKVEGYGPGNRGVGLGASPGKTQTARDVQGVRAGYRSLATDDENDGLGGEHLG